MTDSKIRYLVLVLFGLAGLLPISSGHAADGCTAAGCHSGISDIVPMTLGMMQLIKQTGQRHGDPDGCIICHGGNPDAKKKKKAHRSIPSSLLRAAGPKDFYPDPGSLWIAKNTCGVCHPGYVYRSKRSLMNTEAGKIQSNSHAWGIEPAGDHTVLWANHDLKDTDGPVPSGAAPAYETYMAEMIRLYPNQYPSHLSMLPSPDIQEIEKNPALAGFTYQRQECQRCHISVRGRKIPGEYRGMGCSACHMPYGNDGLYQGNDRSIPRDTPGHILRHTINGNRKTGGIALETCNACHNRGKKIGVSYQGRIASAYPSFLDKTGMPAPKLHGNTYLELPADLHHQAGKRQAGTNQTGTPNRGLLCQDCHTSLDVHGDGNIHGTTLAQVEIECTDCHGTPERLPWDLPLGHKDEFGRDLSGSPARGTTAQKLLSDRQFGFNHDRQEGLLLTARGNPFGNVVKTREGVTVFSATGKAFKVPLLQQISLEKTWKTNLAPIAMSFIPAHLKNMECYACHSAWTAQTYGNHVRVTYQEKIPTKTDWVASANVQTKNGGTAESKRGSKGILSPGLVRETPSFSRWEDPVLGINGEGNISPLMPGTQIVYTVIGKNGSVLVHNQMAENKTQARSIGQEKGLLSMDMAPAQPHTNQKKARSCENCHTRLKTAGLGMEGTSVNFKGIDWTQVVTQDGRQLATVGTHWPLSRALNTKDINALLKSGTCLGCHSNMADKTFWKKVSTNGRLDAADHQALMHRILKNPMP